MAKGNLLRTVEINKTKPSKLEVCCISLGKLPGQEKVLCQDLEGRVGEGALVRNADLIELMSEDGYRFLGENICLPDPRDAQINAFCNECEVYIANLARRVDAGEVKPYARTPDYKDKFKAMARRLALKKKRILKSTAPDRIHTYLLEIKDDWEQLGFLQGAQTFPLGDLQDDPDYILSGSINTKDNGRILIVQMSKDPNAPESSYLFNSAIIRENKYRYILKDKISQDGVVPYVDIASKLDGMIHKGLPIKNGATA